MADVTLLTREEYTKLEAERDELITVKRQEVSDKLREAISYGDLSENAEYDAAKDFQVEVEQRINEIEDLLRNSQVVNEDDITCDYVNVGLKVTVENMSTGDNKDYVIVGSTGSDPFAEPAKISTESPIGGNLLGKKVGDVVDIAIPDGTIQFKVLDIARA